MLLVPSRGLYVPVAALMAGGTASSVGAAAGTSTAAGVGAATAASAGSSSGVGAASGAAEVWTTTFNVAFTSNDPGNWSNLTMRQVLAASVISTSGTQCRFTFQSGTTEDITIGAARIQQQAASGDAFDFSTTPVQITFGGSSGVNIPVNSKVVSDTISFAIDETKNHVIAIFVSNIGSTHDQWGRVSSGQTGCSNYFSTSSGDDTATVNPLTAAYSLQTNNAVMAITKIEVI